MKCSKCKNPLDKNAKFCPICGTKVKKYRMRKILLRLLLLLIISVGVGIAGWKTGILDNLVSFDKEYVMENIPKIRNSKQAIAHAKKLGKAYGYKNAFSELTERNVDVVDGDYYYRLQQNYKGIPVYKRTVVYAVNEKKNVTDITGNAKDVDENIDLSPSVTQAQVAEGIRIYAQNTLNEETENYAEIEALTDSNLCIYNLSKDGQSHLGYCVMMNGYEFVVDAKSGQMLSVNAMAQNVTGYAASDVNRENGFPVEKTEDGFELIDGTLYGVGDLRGKSSKNNNLAKTHWIVSTDNIFGNDKNEKNYEEAVRLYNNLRKTRTYFKKICGFECTVCGIFNDGQDNGKNAYGGTWSHSLKGNDYIGYISMGKVTGVDNINVIGHEYGHVISCKLVDWIDGNGNVENRAINEGISDIYGEIVKTWYYGKNEPDWIYSAENIGVRRNLRDPYDSDNASYISDMPKEKMSNTGKGYYYSTIISHTAYLMWNGMDGNESYKISLEDIVKLWYRAMEIMPSDCDFIKCRKIVERAALAMNNLTDRQRECIGKAFDKVGIQKTETTDDEDLYIDYDNVLVVNITGSKADLYDTYLKASRQITDAGSWQEALNGDIDIDISSQDEKQNATIKATLESHANVSSFDAQNLSALKVSGDARIQAANESMAWSVEYSDGVAHCHYTEPTDYTADVEIDATYFNFYGLTEDMIQDASRTENEISFTIAGENMTTLASEAASMMNGVENVKYGDGHITAAINPDTGRIDNLKIIFQASMTYQGYQASANYNLDYKFSFPQIVRRRIPGDIVDAYGPVFVEYQQAIDSYDESNAAQLETQFPNVREALVKNNKYNGTEIWYGFYDIDGNGMEELIFATQDEQAIGGYRIADIFTYDVDAIQILNIGKDIISSEDVAEGLYNSMIYENGVFRLSSTDSEILYSISEDGRSMEQVKKYNKVGGASTTVFYFNGSESLNSEEFSKRVIDVQGAEAEIEWKKLSEVVVY